MEEEAGKFKGQGLRSCGQLVEQKTPEEPLVVTVEQRERKPPSEPLAAAIEVDKPVLSVDDRKTPEEPGGSGPSSGPSNGPSTEEPKLAQPANKSEATPTFRDVEMNERMKFVK